MVQTPWRQPPLTTEQENRLFMLLLEDDTEDAPWMVMGDLQFWSASGFAQSLRAYAHEQGLAWYVAAMLPINFRWPGVPTTRTLAPDTFVSFVPERARTSYDLEAEGVFPPFVLEVVSPSSKRRDHEEKLEAYDLLGVREYALFTPRGGGASTLDGYRRGSNGALEPWEPDALVGHAAFKWNWSAIAADPPRRRARARRRRSRRFPSQTKGVGSAFHPSAVSSNQSMRSSGVAGSCPARARRTMMRCTDSAMLSHDPESGVYKGSTPWRVSQRRRAALVWPTRLSQTRISRSGGRGAPSSQLTHRSQWRRRGRSAGRGGGGDEGSAARMAASSAWSQGCSTTLGALVTPLTRTVPVAGWNSVSSLAVPPRMYSWGWHAGRSSGSQLAPPCGIAW